jgi:hypothetical protein
MSRYQSKTLFRSGWPSSPHIFPCAVKSCQREAAVICLLTPLALDVLRAASDTIPALQGANIAVTSVLNVGPGDGACVAAVQLSDGQIARLRYAVGDQPQVIENVRIIGLEPSSKR